MLGSCFITIEQSLGYKDLASEKLEDCELFCTRKILYSVAQTLAKFNIWWHKALLNFIFGGKKPC
jgi:hypothetical protein